MNCCDRCAEGPSVAETSRDTVPRDSDVTPTAGREVESVQGRPLFEDISDAEDDVVAQSSSTVDLVVSGEDPDPKLSLLDCSTFQTVQSWSPCRRRVSDDDDCSSSLPAATTFQSFSLTTTTTTVDLSCPVSPPPPVDDITSTAVVMTSCRAMTPLTIDTDFEATHCRHQLDVSDVRKTSPVTSDVAEAHSSPPPFLDEAAAASSDVGDGLSPSPPKIPRLRIVMGPGGDSSQSSTSPGSASSLLPYVVTLDDPLGDHRDDDDDDDEQQQSPQPRDVIDDVTESSSVESASRQRRKTKQNGSAKVRRRFNRPA